MSVSFVIINVWLVDLVSGYDGFGGIFVENGLIVQIGEELDFNLADEVIDVGGKVLVLVLIDLCVFKELVLILDGENQFSLVAGVVVGGFGIVVLVLNEYFFLQIVGGFVGMICVFG